jgi:hypothetical protein
MEIATRRYLAEIGRRGGTRSRRVLTAEQARAMVVRREARRAVREFERSPLRTAHPEVPGADLVVVGLRDLAAGAHSAEALLVSIAAPRLRLLGIRVSTPLLEPEDRLFALLTEVHGDGAHSRYNALVRRMVSFARAAAVAGRERA